MKRKLSLTIVAVGETASGKSLALRIIERALNNHFEITGFHPVYNKDSEGITLSLELKQPVSE